MAISGPGGVDPSKKGVPVQRSDIPAKDFINLEGTKESLLHVVHALKSQPKKSVAKFYKQRYGELKRELEALQKIEKLLKEKPPGYESQLTPYLMEGETVEHMAKVLPLELHIVHEKLKALETARVLTENLE